MSKERKYDVALSFAGEDRACAEALACALKRRGLSVFYDKDEQYILWGKNLYTYLSNLYQNQARYCVILLSKHYAKKRWTKHELEAAQASAFNENKEYILPVHLDDTEISGILSTVGYVNWSDDAPETIGDLIIKKLNKSPLSFDWTEDGPRISGNGVVISPTESTALLARYRESLPKFIESEKERRQKKSDEVVRDSASFLSVLRACIETYHWAPDEEEIKGMKSELSRKYDLFFRFVQMLEEHK